MRLKMESIEFMVLNSVNPWLSKLHDINDCPEALYLRKYWGNYLVSCKYSFMWSVPLQKYVLRFVTIYIIIILELLYEVGKTRKRLQRRKGTFYCHLNRSLQPSKLQKLPQKKYLLLPEGINLIGYHGSFQVPRAGPKLIRLFPEGQTLCQFLHVCLCSHGLWRSW